MNQSRKKYLVMVLSLAAGMMAAQAFGQTQGDSPGHDRGQQKYAHQNGRHHHFGQSKRIQPRYDQRHAKWWPSSGTRDLHHYGHQYQQRQISNRRFPGNANPGWNRHQQQYLRPHYRNHGSQQQRKHNHRSDKKK